MILDFYLPLNSFDILNFSVSRCIIPSAEVHGLQNCVMFFVHIF